MYNSSNNGGTAHLFGTTKKLQNLRPMSQPRPAERQGMPKQAPPMAPMQAPTFAQMQQQGQARPAPAAPVAAPMGDTYMPSSQQGIPANQDIKALTQQAQQRRQQQQNPILRELGNRLSGGMVGGGRFDSDLYNRLRDQALGDLDAAFAGRRQALDEEMARRGLYASSGPLGAGARMGDLEGQYARARGGIETDLLRSAAETQWQDRTARDQMMMSLAQMLAGMKPKDMQKFLQQLNMQQQQGG
jgi:hypothetical protein